MIRNWHLENFKSIRDMQNLDLSLLTIISGANSSGKSTLIQSIQLMMQTLINRENVPLQFNGELVTLGQVGDVWHNGWLFVDDIPSHLCIQMMLRHPYDHNLNIFLHIAFEAVAPAQVRVVRGEYGIGVGDNPAEFSEQLHIIWDPERDTHTVAYISDALSEKIVGDLYSRGVTHVESFDKELIIVEDFYPREIRVEAQTKLRELSWGTALSNPMDFPDSSEEARNQYIPDEMWSALVDSANSLKLPGLESGFTLGFRKKRRQINTFGEYITWFRRLTTAQAHDLANSLSRKLPGIVVDEKQWHTVSFFEVIENTLAEVFTRRIRYLSANRIAPTLLFAPGINATWSEVGVTGANVAPAIREYGSKVIDFWNPFNQQVERATLAEALIIWLHFFELVEHVEAEDYGKLGTQLKVFAAGVEKPLDLTSVGFGTSQVLPIIVQGLLTPVDGIFIVEQPEVHLHPRVQSQLGDFFIALTRVGIQCIIETHSEHIINRVRLRIVEDENNEILNRIRIYFVEKIGAESQFTGIGANEYGAIRNWPQGFFDQVENENLLIAKIASKKRRASKKE